MKFLPYSAVRLSESSRLPSDRRPIGDGLTLVAQWWPEINRPQGFWGKTGSAFDMADDDS
jgi:hypothetical protein